MNWIETAIAEGERELEVLDQARGETEHALATLRKLAPAHVGAAKKPVAERTSARRAPAARSRPDRAPVHTSRAAMSAPASSDVVVARDAAILARLKKGPAPFADLHAAMPTEAGRTADQRYRDCSNALTRLRLKKQVRVGKDGEWGLV